MKTSEGKILGTFKTMVFRSGDTRIHLQLKTPNPETPPKKEEKKR